MRSGHNLIVALLLALALKLSAGTASAAAFHGGGVPDTNAVVRMEQQLRKAMALAKLGSNVLSIGGAQLNIKQRTVAIPARVHLTNQLVEYALVTEYGKGYESLLTTFARAEDIHVACLLLGLAPSSLPADTPNPIKPGKTNSLSIEVLWVAQGVTNRVELASLIQLTSGHPDPGAPALQLHIWFYNGSTQEPSGFAASNEGSIISLVRDPVALINNPGPDRDRDECHFPFESKLPPAATDVTVILKRL